MADRGSRALGIAGREDQSFCVLPGRSDVGLVLICDHASNAIPEPYGTLGLPPDQLRRHIAYDIGAGEMVRRLSAELGAPAILSRFSRLLIDPNRGRDDPTLIMRLSDGAVIPGNRKLDAAEREKRLRLFYDPYHAAIDAVIDHCLAASVQPKLLSVHSFTESWKEHARPWHASVLWGPDARLARPLLEAFYAEGDLIVGENEPYEGQLIGDCLWQHGAQRGLANAIVEIRQDLIRDAEAQAAWGKRLCRIVEKILGDTAPIQVDAAPAPKPAEREAPSPAGKGRWASQPHASRETAT
jgi:predicted N-formylglutamate amidohydrolase